MPYIIPPSYPHFMVDKSREPRHTNDYTLWITFVKRDLGCDHLKASRV